MLALQFENHSAINFTEKAELFRKVLFPPPLSYDTKNTNTINFQSEINWISISGKEVENAIFSFNPKKTPGPDGINFLYL